jgi:D-alanine-D-alanine ligase
MKKTIAIITGGDSSEVVISLRSAEQVKICLDNKGYQTYIVFIKKNDWHVKFDDQQIPINRHDFSFTLDHQKITFDYAFFAMHGPPGEDGKLQAYFDLLEIPYNTSGVLSLALTFNKYSCKSFLSQCGVNTPRALLLKKIEDIDTKSIISEIGLPCFIKPNCGGSSFGVSKISSSDELQNALQIALKEDTQVLVEEFIGGTELTCGLVKLTDRELIFPVTEVISKKDFFDYEAKYTYGMAEEFTPARITEELSKQCQVIASRIYDYLDCRGLVRIDSILSNGEFYFLELNGIPGMTKKSIIPQQIRVFGLTVEEVYDMIIRDTAGW